MNIWYVDVDMVLTRTRSSQGHLSVQGSWRHTLLTKYHIPRTKILQEYGPTGSNLLVRLYGSYRALTYFLQEHHYEGYTIRDANLQ